ncbi:DUF1223 domain-containing protein [Flavobacteriaceae bacterium R38]|nr:DUF1223 domain-containing protein [Flavobacteriaceae bacterium R38]
MKKLLLVIIVISVFGFSTMKEENEAFEPVVVLELFTSQGCSSCPSADKLLSAIREEYQEDNVFALSYHVTYWNYIGWEDPFSKEQYTDKQREYAQKFRSRSIYTPQLVVNGREHFVGSDRFKLYNRLKSYGKASAPNGITINAVKTTGDQVSFNFDVKGNLSNKKLRTVLVIEERETDVKRGENRNRKLVNSNIVVAEKYLSAQTKGSSSIKIPQIVESSDKVHLMVLVEDDDLTITAAVKKAL